MTLSWPATCSIMDMCHPAIGGSRHLVSNSLVILAWELMPPPHLTLANNQRLP